MKNHWVCFLPAMFVISLFFGCQGQHNRSLSDKSLHPFNGKDLSGWKLVQDPKYSKWVVGTAEVDPRDPARLITLPGTGQMINLGARYDDSINIYTAEKFGDCRIELEVMIPKGSNSGIFVSGEYEIQVLDSFGKEKPEAGDMGGVVGIAAPRVNAAKTPGQWQKFVIEYRAPRFDPAGEKLENARFLKVVLNGQTIHKNLELPNFTPSGLNEKEAPTGPLLLQGNHGFVAYRSILITLRSKSESR
jgi:hypothetical protein